MMPGPTLRLALRDARDVARSRSWLVLFFSPLLLALLMVLLILSVSLLMTLLKVAAPGRSPIGHDTVAVVMGPTEDAAAARRFDEVVAWLRQPAPDAPAEARLMRRFVGFMMAARPGTPAGRAEKGLETGGAGGKSRSLEVVALPGEDLSRVAALVPGTYDAALLLEPAGGGMRFRIAYEPGLLYSRLMQRRVVERLEAFNRERQRVAARSGPIGLTVRDHRGEPPDLWLVQSIFFLMSLGLVFIYHSVAVQSVAGVLAGERESRTLEVLLSLPVTRRQVLYGKTLALVATTAAPTLFWSAWLWAGLWWIFRIPLPYGPLALLLVGLHTWMMSVGCAVSASSANVVVARSRLGMVNMVFFALGGSLLALPSMFWPWGVHPLAGLVGIVTGGAQAWPLLALGLTVLFGGAVLVLELGHLGFRKA